MGGVAVDCGYAQTFIAPVFEGAMLNSLFVKQLAYGGRACDEFLRDLLLHKHPNYKLDAQECDQLKRATAYVSMNFVEEEADATMYGITRQFMLPDGKQIKVIDINAERFQCVELMFAPTLRQQFKDEEALPYAIAKSIGKNAERSMQRLLFENIIVCGGQSMIPGLIPRLEKEVTHLSPASMTVNIDGSPQRNIASFTGASILAAHSQMSEVWITAEMYAECGAECLAVRCF